VIQRLQQQLFEVEKYCSAMARNAISKVLEP